MAGGKWVQELLFIKRDENGVIVAISEQTPVGYFQQETNDKIFDDDRFDIIE